MAPPHKSVAELGTVAKNRNGWRARVKLDGQYSSAPQRATCAEAQTDLDAGRQCTSREEMSKFFTKMRRNSDVELPKFFTSPQMASTKETISGVPQPAGMELALPALDAEILTQVRALNRYPKRGKDKAENLLAMRISKRWLDLLPSTRQKLEALQKCGEEELQQSVVQKLLEELRNFGRKPVEYRNTATPAQEHERLLANKFSVAKHRGKLTSSQIKELEEIWA